MAIELQTNDESKVLRITNMAPDSFVLHVRFNGFSGTHTYAHYDTSAIDLFMRDLSSMQAANQGRATYTDCEGSELTFELDEQGHLEVRGTMKQHSPIPQTLQFGFMTDQTCLQPFIAEITKARQNFSK